MDAKIARLKVERMTVCTKSGGLIHGLHLPPLPERFPAQRNRKRKPVSTFCGAPSRHEIVLRFAPSNPHKIATAYSTPEGKELLFLDPCPECFPRDAFLFHLRARTFPDPATGSETIILSALQTLSALRQMGTDSTEFNRARALLIDLLPDTGAKS